MLHTVLLALLANPAHARTSPSVFECPKDTNGYQLSVSFSSHAFSYLLTFDSTRDKFTGTLARTWPGGEQPAVLKASDLRVEVPRVRTRDVPVTYMVHDEDEVRIVCRKGPLFETLFQRLRN